MEPSTLDRVSGRRDAHSSLIRDISLLATLQLDGNGKATESSAFCPIFS